jgi:hypothetical protein
VSASSSITSVARECPRLPGRRHRTALEHLAVAFALLGLGLAHAQDASPLENQVKAAFLARFPLFVEWPAATFTNAQAPIVIGILGKDPLGPLIDEAVRSAKVDERPVRLQRFQDVSALEPCHLLFVPAAEQKHLREILLRLDGQPVLTIGEGERFARDGGMIAFTKEAGKVRFEINLDAARRAGLRLSPKLVQVSKVVGASG